MEGRNIVRYKVNTREKCQFEQLDWLYMASVEHNQYPKFDCAIGDPSKGAGTYFRRLGLNNLVVDDVYDRLSFFNSVNVSGGGQADHPLSVYITSSKSEPQSILLMDDLTLEQCRDVSDGRMHMIVETSPGKHHLWLATSRPVSVDERYKCQVVLQRKYSGDAGSVSGDHLGRLCGVKNTKYNDVWVNLINVVFDGRRANVDALISMYNEVTPTRGGGHMPLPLECVQVASQIQVGHAGFVQGSIGQDQSRKEWGWALAYLRSGRSLDEGVLSLAQRALDRKKHSSFSLCEKYARRTFQKAQKIL